VITSAKHHLLADWRQAALVEEALHALALHLGGVDVALAVDADVVEVFELTRAAPYAPKAADHLPSLRRSTWIWPLGSSEVNQ
jgi:hypothetical protein